MHYSCGVTEWCGKLLVSGGAPLLDRNCERLQIITIKEDVINIRKVHTARDFKSPITYIFDLQFISLFSMKVDMSLEPRFGHTCHVVGNHLVLVGGVGLNHVNPGIRAYDSVFLSDIHYNHYLYNVPIYTQITVLG